MASPEEKEGVQTPESGGDSSSINSSENGRSPTDEAAASSSEDRVEDPYTYNEDPYAYEGVSYDTPAATAEAGEPEPAASSPGGSGTPPEPPAPADDENDDDEGMLRMSFMEHLEELRSRIIKALAGVGVAFGLSLFFANDLWLVVSEPAMAALKSLGVDPPKLAQITPMETFNTVWIKLPMLTAIFLASPWILYQVWAFIAPGLYKKERRWAGPFVLCSAGLFILGGLFAYFVAFRFGLTFLLGIGRNINIQPLVSVTEYFNLFVNVTLGVGIVFELPVLIFFLTLLRITNPAFLLRNARYAILAIVILAAIVTPTPDIFNLMIFSVPMVLLFFVGIFASYLLILNREGRSFPWKVTALILFAIVAGAAAIVYFFMVRYGYHFEPHWPFLLK